MVELVYVNNEAKLKYKTTTKTEDIPKYAIEDCNKIQKSLKLHNLEISLGQAYDLYHAYSEYQYCSSWTDGVKWLSEDDIATMLDNFIYSMEII